MKTLHHGWLALTLFSALASASGLAQAESWGGRVGVPSAYAQHSVQLHGGWGGGWGHRGGGGFRGGYGYSGGWVAPLVGAALVGGAIYAATPPAPVIVQQPPVVYPQQPVITDPARVHYFCQSYQQYYPNVTQCPTPWQLVPY